VQYWRSAAVKERIRVMIAIATLRPFDVARKNSTPVSIIRLCPESCGAGGKHMLFVTLRKNQVCFVTKRGGGGSVSRWYCAVVCAAGRASGRRSIMLVGRTCGFMFAVFIRRERRVACCSGYISEMMLVLVEYTSHGFHDTFFSSHGMVVLHLNTTRYGGSCCPFV
jgi:hypothetical protein